MVSITQTFIIQAPVKEVWRALTDPDLIEQWGAGPAVMKPRLDFDFELWGAEVWGKNIGVIPYKQLKQEWYTGDWEQPSIVTFDLAGDSTQTTIMVTQDNLPDKEKNNFESGWEQFYFKPIKQLLEKRGQDARQSS